MSEEQVLKDGTIFEGYKILKQIGKGSFGTVYEVCDDSGNRFALKLEVKTIGTSRSQLQNEYKVYMKMQKIHGIPKVYYFARTEDTSLSYLIIERLEVSLNDILEERKGLSLKTVAMLGKRIIEIIRQFHKNQYIYRDMKPENILVKNGNEIYLIDFGMSKRYLVDGLHIPIIYDKVLTGTARYASVNTHKGLEQSRRDDLEGIGYVLIYLLKGGELPWMGIPAPTRKEKYKKIGDMKEQTSIKSLCNDLNGKEQFIKYMKYCRELGFEEKPDYDYLINLFDEMLDDYKLKDDGLFDWMDNCEPQQDRPSRKRSAWQKFKSIFSFCGSSK